MKSTESSSSSFKADSALVPETTMLGYGMFALSVGIIFNAVLTCSF